MKRFLYILFVVFSFHAEGQIFPGHVGVESKHQASGPTTYISDHFTGTNGTSLVSHTPDIGGTWVIASEGLSCSTPIDIKIQSNTATPDAGLYSEAYINASHADVVASMDFFVPNTGSYLGAMPFRYTSCTSYFILAIERDGGGTPYMAIYEQTGGGLTQRATVSVPAATNSTLNLKVTLSGTSIVALAGTGETCNYTSSNNQTATNFGIFGYSGGGYTIIPVDNLLITN